jgi:hypothetical protein
VSKKLGAKVARVAGELGFQSNAMLESVVDMLMAGMDNLQMPPEKCTINGVLLPG